jgi:prevent-host-death family protein
MTIINMHQAKTELSNLVARAEAGEEIVIARHNKPAVKLVPVTTADKTAVQPSMPGTVSGFAEDKQAEYDLGALRQAVEAGREFTIMQDGRAIAKVVPIEPKSRGWGAWEGRYRVPDSFFDPLPEEELRAWEGLDEPSA